MFDLDAVGIANVKHPITITSNLEPKTQTTIGTFKFSSGIEKASKGTNMSRFTEQLQSFHQNGFVIDLKTMKGFTKDLADRLKQKMLTWK